MKEKKKIKSNKGKWLLVALLFLIFIIWTTLLVRKNNKITLECGSGGFYSDMLIKHFGSGPGNHSTEKPSGFVIKWRTSDGSIYSNKTQSFASMRLVNITKDSIVNSTNNLSSELKSAGFSLNEENSFFLENSFQNGYEMDNLRIVFVSDKRVSDNSWDIVIRCFDITK